MVVSGYSWLTCLGNYFLKSERRSIMKNLLSRFWRDEAGFVISSELVLVATILVIGMITGLTAVRDGVVQELGDVGQAIGAVDQDYTFLGVAGHSAATSGSIYVDLTDFCDTLDTADAEPSCLIIGATAADTGEAGPNEVPVNNGP
jgi:Flp pilus assembly pilin Flp